MNVFLVDLFLLHSLSQNYSATMFMYSLWIFKTHKAFTYIFFVFLII